ncbi:hypothetical protein SAMN05519104_6629 [Rhizobiales bacterium GAS188]|nr:hypothetical protein SAMN05519104_6629 [Rhizobiales bacterium GAS188]
MPIVDQISTFASAPAGSSSPDSVTIDGQGFVWVAYTNGADSTGASGSSTIVQYDKSGHVVHSYQVAGFVDGLKFNPESGEIWALQNQDGNSKLTLIDPITHETDTLSYAHPSSTRGYDDVVFDGNKVFLSFTNPPGTSGDATIVQLTNGDNPHGVLHTKTVLTDGIQGINTETGTLQSVPLTDPDSLKLAPNGDLLLSSGADGVIVDVQDPGTSHQSVAFTQVQGVTPGNAGLDDVIKPSASSGTFYLSDTKDNRVLAVHVSGLNPNDYYASVGSLGAFGQVDPTTGAFTPLISAANAPGFNFGSPHGVTFVADENAAPTPIVDRISTLASAPKGSSSPDSVTIDGQGFVWVAYTNGADSTGASGSSTIVQYDKSGHVVHSYQVAGFVDGLKFNPESGEIWALQNQDGNSKLTLIDPITHETDTLSYAHPSSTRGYDDVVFDGNKVFLSFTNPPGTSGDATIVQLTNGDDPHGLLHTKTVLTDGIQGINTETDTLQSVPMTDPDSLKLAPNGDLLLSSGADGVIVDVKHPGTSHQSVAFTQVQGVTPGNAGLDDVIKPSASSGTFYLSDTKDNRVLAVHVSGLNPNDYYASVGSLGAFGQVDSTTGAFTPVVSAANAPGFEFGSPHGVAFVADQSADTDSHVALLKNYMASSFVSTGSGSLGGFNPDQSQSTWSQQALLTQPQHDDGKS